MRKFLLAFVLVCFAAFAGALTINAPAELPAGVSWSFSVEFAALDFTDAKLFLDGAQLTTLYIYNGALSVVQNSVSQELVSNVGVSGNKVFVSMNGAQKGERLLAVEVFNNSEKKDSQSLKVIVSDSLDASIKQRLDSMQGTLNSLVSETNELKTKQAELSSAIAAMQLENTGLNSKTTELNTALQAVNEKIRNVDGEINLLVSDIGALQGSSEEFLASVSGKPLFSLANAATLSWILGILIVVFAALFAIKIVKSKGIDFGRRATFDNYDKPMDSGSLKQSVQEQSQGKWSFEKATEKPAQGKISFSRLIKRS